MTLPARCGSARLMLQIDMGLGDSVWPPPQLHAYPALLEFPPPTVLAYPPEAVVADMPDVGKFSTPVPPILEQDRIVAFIRKERARIDGLVAKKERLIELLQEKRAALITRAVTKGLDPSVPMKDSGVEWLGSVPSQWGVAKLKTVSSLQTGITLGKKYELPAFDVRPYLRVANVQDGHLDLSDVATIELPQSHARRYELRAGDVLMTEGGDFDKLGRGFVREGQIAGCLHQNHIFAVRPIPTEMHPHFLSAVMASGYGRAFFTATSKQSTNLASTNGTTLKNFPVPLPPRHEQDQILRFVAAESGMLDRLVQKVSNALDRLRELRTALISAALTGKIDVRAA